MKFFYHFKIKRLLLPNNLHSVVRVFEEIKILFKTSPVFNQQFSKSISHIINPRVQYY